MIAGATSQPRHRLRTLATVAVTAVALLAACSTPAATPTDTAASTEPSGSLATGSPVPSAPATGSPLPSLAAGPGRIAFARQQPDTKIWELYTVNPDGSDLKELLPHWTYGISLPRWSWSGTYLVARASSPTVLSVDAPHHLHLFPSTPLDLVCSAWSPDGTTLACDGSIRDKPGHEGIYLATSATGSLLPFVDEHVDIPDPTRITTPSKGIHDVPGDYSADGRIVFVRTSYAVLGLGEIWIANGDGTNAHKLTDTLSTYEISWSRDGRWIVGERAGVLELFDLQDLGADPARITIKGGTATEPRFSPDGSQIVFVFTKTGAKTTSIESVGLDGTKVVQITHGFNDRSPDWAFPGF